MKCAECNRELRDDSQFCDRCGKQILQKEENDRKKTFNASALIIGIILSILISLLITGSAAVIGIPFLFGGLFLPFFWRRKNKY